MLLRCGLMRGLVAVVLLATLVGATLLNRAGINASPADPSDVDLALVDLDGQLKQLDPASLADAPAGKAIDLGDVRDVVRSGDGSTIATISPRGGLIVIRDGRSGAERLRFQPPVLVLNPRISDDGTRLVVERSLETQGASFGWIVFDTRDGSVLATITPPDGWVDPVVDRRAQRLYYFAQPSTGFPDGPEFQPAVLVAYDLTTGVEAARVTLADVPHGYQHAPGDTNHEMPGNVLEAGLAVSPDGRLLAVAPADRDEVLLLDATSLSIQRTLAMTRPVSTTDRVLGFLGLAPQSAAAKSFNGIKRRISFGPDGRHVVLFGSQETANTDAFEQWSSGLGLTVVEVATGQIVAEGLEGDLIHAVRFSPDGSQLYTAGPAGGRELVAWIAEPEGYVRSYVIRRLDLATLDVLVERELAVYPRLLVAPGAPRSH